MRVALGCPLEIQGPYWLLLGSSVEFRCTRYDLAAATERIRATNYPQAVEFEVLHPPPETQMLEVFESAALR